MNHTTLGLHPRTAHIVITRTAFDRAYTHYLIRFHAELVVLSVDEIKGPNSSILAVYEPGPRTRHFCQGIHLGHSPSQAWHV
jgi:hypothetical protein